MIITMIMVMIIIMIMMIIIVMIMMISEQDDWKMIRCWVFNG